MLRADCRVLIFARAPVPGRVKTRLVPALGEAGATALYRRLLEQTLRTVAALQGHARAELFCTPTTRDPLLRELAGRYGATLHEQQGRDLGERMAGAARAGLARGGPVILLGCDAPAVDAGLLTGVCAALQAGADDAVLVPALDGGYVLLGMRRYLPEVFGRFAWGTGQVAAQTRAALRRAGRTWSEPACLWDVDRPEDLARLRALPGWSDLAE